jgi:hypothetical protein
MDDDNGRFGGNGGAFGTIEKQAALARSLFAESIKEFIK